MSKLHTYILGPETNHELSLEYWGERRGSFPDLESALYGLFLSHPFPAALTGRRDAVFYPGLSLDQTGEHEVVQVWSTEPDVVKRYSAAVARHNSERPKTGDARGDSIYVPHIGDGTNAGLACEVHVGMIARFQTPRVIGLLTDGTTGGAASPAGRMALAFTPQARASIQLRAFQMQFGSIVANHQAASQVSSVREQLAHLNEGLRLLSSYCSGTNGVELLRRGDRAPAAEPYRLFQTRVYLGEELGLIANLDDMDHTSMAQVDAWLLRRDRWKKLLPYNKCILVSRVRRDEKRYENVFEELYHNAFNMESLVWVRDGQNVWRFATDIKFEERVFPNADDAPTLVTRVREQIWKSHFKLPDSENDRFSSHARVSDTTAPKHPEREAEPVPVAWADEVAYSSLQDFTDSPHYPPEVDVSIQRRVNDAIRKNSRERMPFALLLQGIIDFKGILNIPAGTDLFDQEQQARYIQLVADFGPALMDSRNAEQFDALTKLDALRPGDRIIGWRWRVYSEKWDTQAKWNLGDKRIGPYVLTVHEADSSQDHWHRLSVHFWRLSKRWGRDCREFSPSTAAFTKDLATAFIPTDFLPIDLPLSLAEKLLDDRAWKRQHAWAVPVLAQWGAIRKQAAAVRGPAPVALELKEVDDL